MHIIAGLAGAAIAALSLLGFNSNLFGNTGTINQLQHWASAANTIKLASTTATLRVPFLANCDTIDTDGSGIFSCGTDASGAGSGGISDPFTHPQAGTSATTSGMIFTAASSTFTQQINAARATTTLLTATTAWLGRTILDADQDTYFEAPSDDSVVFTIGGVESEKFNGTQVVFNESGADRDFRAEAVGEPYAFFVQGSDGRIGLGTDSPQARIEALGVSASIPVSSWFGGATFGVTFLDDQTQTANLNAYAGATATNRPMNFLRRARGTLAIPTAVQSGDWLGSLISSGHDGTDFEQGAAINFEVDGTVANNSIPTAIDFETGTSFSDRTERMRILSGGNVGIGTSSPYTRLSVVGETVARNFTATSTAHVSSFTNASTTLFSTGYASSTLWYGGGLASTCASGSFLTWTGGQFGCDTDDNSILTAGDALTLTGTDIDFDGGATPAGDLGGTWASPSVTDDSHAHTSTTISGLDVSADLNLTGGLGLTLTGDDMACDTASGSVFGCLAAADWTTFNGKLGSYDAWTHPTTVTSATTSGMVFNSASSTFTTLLNMRNASSTQLTNTGSTWLTSMTSALLVTDGAGLLAEFAGSTCTNQAATAISALGALTCTTLTPAYLDLTAAWDFGGATSLEIPNGTAPTVDAIGEFALDTTSNQFLVATSTAAGAPAVFSANLYPSFTIATSTAWTGSSTDPLGTAFVAEWWDDIQCFTDAGTVVLAFGDGTATTSFFRASATVSTVQLNKAFTASAKRYINYGSPVTAPTKLSCTLKKQITRD